MSEVDSRFTFETFVVGPANRLASAAARRAAESPGTNYNPLFVYSASGLGKSHILGAVANHAARTHPGKRVRYQTLEAYIEDLAAAIQGGSREDLREEYRELDILLLDDVQFLAGQPEAQEMILATLDGLIGRGAQIVLASDRPPSEINGLDARLVSRFSGGLIVDIAPPEFETRVAIIRRRVEERGQTLETGVAEALAKRRYRNVRELTGALNRVLAVQELEERRLHPVDIADLLGGEREAPQRARAVDEVLGSFLSEVAGAVAEKVQVHEEPWRRAVREVVEEAEREGFTARRLRALAEAHQPPPDWTEQVESFRRGLARLREIVAELHRLRNPWPDAAATLVRDPERVEEAETFLASVRERTRRFPVLAAGPDLEALSRAVPALVVKAAQQLATAERPQYNPLFLWSRNLDAAGAVLAAAGRTFRSASPQGTVAVTSIQWFAEDFIRALSEGVAGAWRERWWTVDLLLVHGAQALADTERAQDEFFHLFEALKRRGARVLLTADRPPHAIERIDDRLRSRFEGGLVLEVEAHALPAGSESVTLEAPPGEGEESGWEGLARDVAAPGAPAGSATGADEGGRRGGVESGPWVPSRENVVWVWPRLEARLLEELE